MQSTILIQHSFSFYYFSFLALILLRYFLVAGSTHLLFYSLLTESAAHPKTPLDSSRKSLIYQDIKLSCLASVVFALGAAFIIWAYDRGETLLYSDFRYQDLWYLGVSYGGVLILQDAYFYFVHRILHHPALFMWLHQGHHKSRQPTAWTSFAFDLPEAVIQSFFLIAIVFIIPIHFITLIAISITMTFWAVLNHLGLELFPPAFPHHWLGRWFIGPAHHSIHHRKYTVHYGLYFTFWDRLLGTDDPQYEHGFGAVLKR